MEVKLSLYRKIAEVMGELNVPKDGKNSHFNYAYFTADAVADAVREKLAARNVAFFASIVGREPLTGFSKPRWVVDFKFTFADGDSGETQECTWSAEADGNDDKGINKCATAAEKYFLLKTFIVSTGDEPDADADGSKKRQNAPQGAQNSPQHQSTTTPRQNAPASHSGGAMGGSVDSLTSGLGANVTRIEDAHLPRAADDLPILGSLNMGDILRKAYEAGWVTGKQHFSNLVDLLWREGSVRDASTPKAVLEAICQHYEAKQEAAS